MSKRDLLARYRSRCQMSLKWRASEKFDKTWDRMRDIYAGKQFQSWSDEDRIAVNIAFATINVIGPSIAVNHPKVSVTARKQEDDDKAVITEAVVNYWWKHYQVKPEFRRAVKDYLIYGHGWLKVGYRYEEKPAPLTDTEFQDAFGAAKAEADSYAVANPMAADLLPTDEEIVNLIPNEKQVVVNDRPFVERVSPYDIYVDPEATSMQDATWIAQKITRPLEEVKRDKRYKASVRKKLEGDMTVTEKWRQEKQKASEDVKRVVIWEFYDLIKETVCVFADGGDGFLFDPQPMPYSFGVPFVMLRNYDVPECFYPMGDLEALEPLQNELNETRSAMVQARKLDKRKTFVRRDIGPEAMNALRSDEDNTMVPIDDDRPFDQLASPVPREPANAQMYQHSELIESDVDRVSGVNEYMRGALPEIRRTATEASIIQDAANSRSSDKLDTIEGAIGAVATRLVALAQQYMTGQLIASVVGPNGVPIWVPFSREDIAGEFDFSVEGGSTQPMNDTMKRQQAVQLLQMMEPLIPTGVVILPQLMAHVLKEGFGIKNPEKFIQAVPPAFAQGAIGPGGADPADPNAQPPGAAAAIPQLAGQVGLDPNTLGGAASEAQAGRA